MNYQVVSLFITSILNAAFGYVILRGQRKITNIVFSLIAVAVSLWSVVLGFFILESNLDNALILANVYYTVAAAIPVLFLFFSQTFLNLRHFSRINIAYLIPMMLFLLLMTVDKNILLYGVYDVNGQKNVVFNNLTYLCYGVYFLIYIVFSYYHLIRRYLMLKSSIEKIQIKFILVGTSIALFLGMFFNLLIPAFGIYTYIWLGPIFTIIMIASIGYAITRHHLFDIKVIAVEITISIIWFFVFVQTYSRKRLRLK